MAYYSYPKTKPVNEDQMCICRCPNWCESGYQIATWDGERFDYADSPNDMFDRDVVAFFPLNEDGEPETRKGKLP